MKLSKKNCIGITYKFYKITTTHVRVFFILQICKTNGAQKAKHNSSIINDP